ncbi:helix-turn-helix transcriptional regulator [Pseudonocardia broussonetiae]|uniref:WYL domain-containing protein n=1 Tax=Pseudonocardia broussonetiae TaxID=2736640 RepID=A0A6M6JGD2_9PSEU|nr:WYL domain-containing protein [Pseudonocardia broussonetiae]QJY46203.1 WYL domain-containing protein [Pseudonocardia broussonetiae]
MRADRLLSLLLLLRHRGRMSAAALARELECSTRTVLRDVEALSAAGVPVYAERGRTGGFALLPGYSTDLTGLTHDEARALLVAGSRAPSPALASAMRKVVAALPDAQRDTATRAAGRVLLSPDRMLRTGTDAPPVLRTVQEAVFASRRLRIRYAASGQEARSRTVDPVGLVDAGGQWYLLATHDGAERTYRLSRMEHAEVLDEAAAPVGDVDLEELWERRRSAFRASLPRYAVRVRVRPDRRDGLLRTSATLDAERAVGDRLELDLRFGDPGHALVTVWAVGADAEVLDPPELRAALAERAAATAAVYAGT